MADTIVGDVIKISVGGTLVAMTRGEVTLSSNTNVAESSVHSSVQQLKQATSEAWELSFEKLAQATMGGLETLGVTDSADVPQVIKGSADGPGTITVSVEEEGGAVKATWTFDDPLVVLEDITVSEDDFSTASITIHSRTRPQKTA